MNRRNKGLVFGLAILVLLAISATAVPIVQTAPTAENFRVENTSGYQNTNVLVPVNINNASSGPIAGIGFDISYNNSVISVVGVQAGSLTSGWDFSNAYTNYPWGTRFSIVYGGSSTEIGNGSTGSVALLNFSVIGNPGETTDMNLSNIQLSDLHGNLGTAPAKNGTFTILTPPPTPSPCFIATAAYGTPLHEDIDILRDFRDEHLMTNPIGRTFVKIYYTTSPPIADVIRENEGLWRIVREGLVKPLVYISRAFVR